MYVCAEGWKEGLAMRVSKGEGGGRSGLDWNFMGEWSGMCVLGIAWLVLMIDGWIEICVLEISM